MMLRKRSMASLFVGINTSKASPDAADPARSPTSPLDHMIFSNLGNPFALSPRSSRIIDSPRKSWDSDRVGLGLVDTLLDSRSIVFAPQMRSCRVIMPSCHEITEEIQTMSCPSGVGFIRRVPKPNTEISSSLPPFFGSISASDIELSEDYTRITSHGPNPKTTHIFGDHILEEDPSECIDLDAKVLEVKASSWSVKCAEMDPFPSLWTNGFLSSCCSCRKKLGDGEDIYMYRGEKAFCSSECRDKEISMEEEDMEEDDIPLMV